MTIRASTFALAFCLCLLPGVASAQFMDINSIIAGIGNSEFLRGVENLDSAPSVRTVRLSSLAGAEQSRDRLDSVIAAKPREMAYLHSNILLNPIGRTALRNAGVSVDQIVGLIAENDGAVVLFIDDL